MTKKYKHKGGLIMPFIDSKVSCSISKDDENKLKEQLGKAIELIPGKSESWLMLNFEENCKMYFKGDNSNKIAYVEVSIFGSENKAAFEKLTAKICDIFNDILGISPANIYVKYETTTNWGWNGGNF